MWLLDNLLKSFDGEIESLAFILDMEKFLGDMIKSIFPTIEYKVFIQHLWKTLRRTITIMIVIGFKIFCGKLQMLTQCMCMMPR